MVKFATQLSLYFSSIPKYRPLCLLFMLLIATFLLLNSRLALAIVVNPGGLKCDNGTIQYNLSNTDYKKLMSSYNAANRSANKQSSGYVTIPIDASHNMLMTMSKEESNASIDIGPPYSFRINDKQSRHAIYWNHATGDKNAYATVIFRFFDEQTITPIYLDKVGISAFDIDAFLGDTSHFDDQLIFTGTAQDGSTVTGEFVSIANSNIIYNSAKKALQKRGTTPTSSEPNCDFNSLDTKCQGAIKFEKPVSLVQVVYTNSDRVTQNVTTGQEIELRFDNLCYAPPRTFSGIIFNDNGGINPPQANASNASINSAPYNSSSYFNGLYDSSSEAGIAGSTVQLVDSCDSPKTIYASQTLSSNAATSIGRYAFRVAQNTLNTQNSVCIIETNNSAYPIRTTSDKHLVPIVSHIFSYPNNDFGRVIAENVALVLQKEQFANDCTLPSLTAATIPYSKDPLGKTPSGGGTAIDPNQCIAYKITATNRSNLELNKVIIRDELQQKQPNQPGLSLVLAQPERSSTDNVGYSDTVSYGGSGTIISNPFTLTPKKSKSFYFNTKYGSTQ